MGWQEKEALAEVTQSVRAQSRSLASGPEVEGLNGREEARLWGMP